MWQCEVSKYFSKVGKNALFAMLFKYYYPVFVGYFNYFY